MLAVYVVMLIIQNRRQRAILFGGVAGVILVATFSFAIGLGGESIAERTFTLFGQNPVSLYSESRGGQLEYTFGELLYSYPLGAGLGRWGMVSGYFGGGSTPDSAPLWAEIQVAGWTIDGGIPLLILYVGAIVVTLTSELRTALYDPDAKVRACAGVVVAVNLGHRGADLQLHTVRHADRLAVLVPGGRAARHRDPARADRDADAQRTSTMSACWLLIAGDFAPHGGMDMANFALANYLARPQAALEARVTFATAAKCISSVITCLRSWPLSRPCACTRRPGRSAPSGSASRSSA